MENNPRTWRWATILDITIIALTLGALIFAVVRCSQFAELSNDEPEHTQIVIEAPQFEQNELIVYTCPRRTTALFEYEIYESQEPGYSNPDYSRSIYIVEYEIAEIDPSLYEEASPEVTAVAVEERYLAESRSVIKSPVTLDEDEQRLLASLVTLEVGAESYECQKAVVSVVLNRMVTGGLSLSEVIYQKNQFSVASKVKSTQPFTSCVEAVEDVLRNGLTLPQYVTFFRAGHYHDWGDRYVSYAKIDKTYFSYDTVLKEKWG